MPAIPEDMLQQMLPRAAAWAEKQELFMLRHKDALVLSPEGQKSALDAGVQHPEAVRLLMVDEIPLPEELDLRQAAEEFDLITARTAGLTIGHGIFIREDCRDDEHLIAHELMHVAQYERLGSVEAFLQQYLFEVNEHGYPAAPMEQEAIAFAESLYPTSEPERPFQEPNLK